MNTRYMQPKQAINEATVLHRLNWKSPSLWGKTADERYAAMHEYCKAQSPNSYAENYRIYDKVIMAYSGMEDEVSGLVGCVMSAIQEQLVVSLRMQNQGLPSPIQNGVWVY